MNPRIYVESSIISYLVSRPSHDIIIAGRQVITRDWWDNHRHRFELQISILVEKEIARGDATAAKLRMDAIVDIPSLRVSNQATMVAEQLLLKKAVPKGSEEDALHIGIASTQGAVFLLTWNFKHINNVETRYLITQVVESCDYVCPHLCSPEELMGETHG